MKLHAIVIVGMSMIGLAACASEAAPIGEPQGDSTNELTATAGNVGTISAFAGQPCGNLYPGLVKKDPSFQSAVVDWDGTGCQIDLGLSGCLAGAGYALHYYKYYTAKVSGFVYTGDFYSGYGPPSLGAHPIGVNPADLGDPPAQIGISVYATQLHGAILWSLSQTIATPSTCFGADRSL